MVKVGKNTDELKRQAMRRLPGMAAFGLICFLMGRQSKHPNLDGTTTSRRASTSTATSTTSTSGLRATSTIDNLLPACQPVDKQTFSRAIQCPAACRLEGLAPLTEADKQASVKLTVSAPWQSWTVDYGHHLVHFPEENVWLRSDMLVDAGRDYRPRSITERLFRRIIAKLFRAGVLNPSGNIVNTGSWIGDNAVPWAKMLEQLSPKKPGHVYAIDPSQDNLSYMMHMAQLNNVGNLCAHAAVFSTEATTVYAKGEMDHLRIGEKPFDGGYTLQSIPMDSLNLENVVLLHLDVEGHEGRLLRGAMKLLATSRPIVVTEGTRDWPPVKNKDKRVFEALLEAGYLEQTAEIPEICGYDRKDRNRIWFPDQATRDAAMKVIGDDLARPLVNWISPELPEVSNQM